MFATQLSSNIRGNGPAFRIPFQDGFFAFLAKAPHLHEPHCNWHTTINHCCCCILRGRANRAPANALICRYLSASAYPGGTADTPLFKKLMYRQRSVSSLAEARECVSSKQANK